MTSGPTCSACLSMLHCFFRACGRAWKLTNVRASLRAVELMCTAAHSRVVRKIPRQPFVSQRMIFQCIAHSLRHSKKCCANIWKNAICMVLINEHRLRRNKRNCRSTTADSKMRSLSILTSSQGGAQSICQVPIWARAQWGTHCQATSPGWRTDARNWWSKTYAHQ